MREHHSLTRLLNVLLAGNTSSHLRRINHFWAYIPRDDGGYESKWVQQSFFVNFGECVIDKLSPPAAKQLEEVEPEEYYRRVGHDGRGLRVPTDLDESICLYLQLSPANRAKFDRATFWMDMASRQWEMSVSSSFASLVSAIESLTGRGTTHTVYCQGCNGDAHHEVPGATERFRTFFENYAPGATLRIRRSQMYSLRSSILHGSELMQLDRDVTFGWNLLRWNERELHRDLWSVTHIALRNWLKQAGCTVSL